MRRFAIAALAVLGLAGTAAAEVNVGVTAAVNPQATGALGGNVRTIALGDSVIFNERIQTSGEGLVQILLADGTTFMVGPNSDLTIDSFVYNPGAGTAEVTASFTKGVLRFIGGQTSKTDNGVTLNTPVGTMGIRGAMVDVVLDPPPGTPPHIDMLFGNEVTLADGQQLLGRLYAAGYSLVLGQNGAFEVMKTPPGWGSQIQAALSGQPGTSGGAGKGPGDGDVSRSEVAQNNKPANPPAAPLNERETRQLLEAVAAYDQLRNFILNNQMSQGFVGGVVYTAFPWSYDNEYDPESETEYGIDYDRNPFANLVDFFTGEVQPTTVAFGPDGVPLSIRMPLAILSYSCGAECVTYGYYLGTDGSGEVAFEVDGSPIRYVATSAYLKDYTTYLDPQEVADLELDCQTCSQFMRWGFWGFSLEDIPRNGLSGELGDIDIEAMWVTGNLTTSAQLQNLASQSESNINAHFRGDAVGIVNNVNVEGSYVASGDLLMHWNFGQRSGGATITNFDTANVSGGRSFAFDLETLTGNTTFSGTFEQYDYDTMVEGYGFMQGAFANRGNSVAAGVIGSWGFEEWNYAGEPSLPDYTVGGVFMGERFTPTPP